MVQVRWKMLLLKRVLVRLQEFCHHQLHSPLFVLLLELEELLVPPLVHLLLLPLELRTM